MFGAVGLFVALIFVIVASELRGELERTFRGQIERQLALGDALIRRAPDADPDSLARAITERVDYRVTLIDADGIVLGDSFVEDGQLGQLENHLDRPEVRAVLDEGLLVAFAERSSVTVGTSLLYGARLTALGGRPVVLRIAAPTTDIDLAVDGLRRRAGLSGLLVVLASLLVVYGLSRILSRPLVELAQRARRAAGGQFETKVPSSRVAELRDLSRSFNQLTEELETRLRELGRDRDEMRTLFDCMAEGVIAVTEDARLSRVNPAARVLLGVGEAGSSASVSDVIENAELRDFLEASVGQDQRSVELELAGRHVLLSSRALDLGGAVTTLLDITDLRRLERVRRDFVANASHELKTPLTSIRGYAETLSEPDVPDDLRRQFLAAIHGNTLRLQRLVDDLLDLSRLESGGWVAKLEPVVVGDTLSECIEICAETAGSERKLTFEGEAVVMADRQGLLQLLRNLFENSIQHTRTDGHVNASVEVDEVRRLAVIVVEDDGEGISSEALPRIFERFFRADSARARDHGGTGLGLSIVRHLARAMGGEVGAASEVGVGTRMTVRLPLAG